MSAHTHVYTYMHTNMYSIYFHYKQIDVFLTSSKNFLYVRSGERNGQGAVYFKSEGYLEKEKLLYKGSFKNNFFHGHGTLYWPGDGARCNALTTYGKPDIIFSCHDLLQRYGSYSVFWKI